jgi:fumarate reductase flavoprotein subunit
MERRTFMGSALSASIATSVVNAQDRKGSAVDWDYVIIGAGTAGLPAAIFASRRGARVLLIDAADSVGGTLHLANGQISAGGTTMQAAMGIVDSPDKHYDDIMRMTDGLADPDIIRQTCDNAPAMVNWLLEGGLTPLPGQPETGSSPGRQCYTTPRYIWGANNGRDILSVVLNELQPELESGRVVTQLDTTVTDLIVGDNGSIEGVRAQTPDGERVFSGRHVLITTGGYAMNPDLFEELIHEPTYTSGTYPTNLGKGLELAVSVGGKLRGHELHRSGTGSILNDASFPTEPFARFDTMPQARQPWEIWVNNDGKRFMREDEPIQETRASKLVEQDQFRYAIVFDSDIFESSPPGVPGWTREKMGEHFNTHPMFHKADSLDELAKLAGVSASGLKKTVKKYNKGVKSGSDEFGREHLPSLIDKAPYYAIIHLGSSATSAVGITVDKELRVVKENGDSIPNLYAVGEVMGSGATLGAVFTPGMMLTPALTLGRELGLRLPI